MNYPRYPTYKNSNVTWLLEIPEGWKLQSGRSTFMQTRIKSDVKDEQLSATQKYGVIPQDQFMELEDQKVMLALKGTESFKHVDVDDFVISLRSFEGGIEHCHYNGCVSPAYTILKSRIEIIPDFFAYMFKSQLFIQVIQSVSEGIRDGKTITYEQFSKITLPIPPLSDQSDIAKFLNGAVSKIDLLISKQQQLIELLKEKRQAIITNAVTKGLDTSVPMKDSGIEWIGEVPEHWKVMKIKFTSYVKGRVGWKGLTSEEYLENGYAYLVTGQDFQSKTILWDSCYCVDKGRYDDDSYIQLKNGDLLITKDGTIGKLAIVEGLEKPACLNSGIFLVRPNDYYHTDFLYYILSSTVFSNFYFQRSFGSTIQHLYQNVFEDFSFPIPPMEEQIKIVAYLERQTGKIDKIISSGERMVQLLKEYKTSLISQAVSGKIDIRGFASSSTSNNG
jgi:type I restriction enzyme S subunit